MKTTATEDTATSTVVPKTTELTYNDYETDVAQENIRIAFSYTPFSFSFVLSLESKL